MSKYMKYPSYRDSGVKWLGDIPEHWIKSKVKFTSSIFGRIGFRGYKTADIVDEGEGAITLSPSNMQNGSMIYDKVTYLSWNKYYESPEIQINRGDVVFVKTGSTLGKVGYINTLPHEMTLNPQLIVFKNLKCHSKYLYYLLNTKLVKAYVDNSNNGGTIPTMTQESILNYEVPSCNYEEQQTIANYLDKATAKIDTLIEKQTKLIELLREKRQAVISTVVTRGLDNTVAMKDSGVEWLGEIPEGWEVKKLKYISTVNDDSLSEQYEEDFKINYIDIGSVTTGYINNSEVLLYSKAPSRARRIIEKGDILVSTVRTYLKAIAPVSSLEHKFIASTGFAVIRSKSIISDFMKYALLSNYFVDLVEASSVGISYPAINSSALVEFEIVVASLEEQQSIANYLDEKTSKIDILVTKATKAIDLLKEKRTALISSAVTGKIDVREAL